MHSKTKGTIAVSNIISKFLKLEANIFTEFGDLSRIDLIIEYQKKLIRIQVKFVQSDGSKAILTLRKSGPNGYDYKYSEEDLDFFALYDATTNRCALIPAKVLKNNDCVFVLRLQKSKNNQKQKVNLFENYEDFYTILRDHTLGPKKLGDDRVQTTTVKGARKLAVVS